MKQIIKYISDYFSETNKQVLAACTVFITVLVFINYQYDLDGSIRKISGPVKLIAWYTVFALAFIIPWFLSRLLTRKKYFANKEFTSLLLIAPFVFAIKLTLDFSVRFTGNIYWDNYWQHIIYWPALTGITILILYLCWMKFDRKDQPLYGTKIKKIYWKPYLLMLLIMLPLVAAASTQKDFLAMYPKLQAISAIYHEKGFQWWHKVLFELSYGSDFINIEFFFRGFLVLAFAKWAGKDAILPMACFYCTIHFGKPLGECISSYFGGLILGIVVYNTRSIWGGLMVHLGIAWLMEIGGYIGNTFIR